MRASGTILCAIPKTCWESNAAQYPAWELLRRFFNELETIERRLPKNVAHEDENQRYAHLCSRIEQVALANAVFAPDLGSFRAVLMQGRFPALRLGSEYISLLREVQINQSLGPHARERLGATIFSPQEVKNHNAYFETLVNTMGYQNYSAIRHRVWFLKKRVMPEACGLVEVPDPLSLSRRGELQPNHSGADGRGLWERLSAQLQKLVQKSPGPLPSIETRWAQMQATIVPRATATDWQYYGRAADRGDFMKDRFRSQIREALAQGGPVNLMSQRQNVVTEILQEFIHSDPAEKPAKAPVMYDDGRTARPFPLRCLPKMPDGWRPTKEYHFALISMRHLPLDQYIDMNWYRNVEVPAKDGLAAADEHCYLISMQQLAELLNTQKGHRLRVHLYHTGYMPAIVGFYRAFMTTLTSGTYDRNCLQIVPKLQPDQAGFVEGKPWPE